MSCHAVLCEALGAVRIALNGCCDILIAYLNYHRTLIAVELPAANLHKLFEPILTCQLHLGMVFTPGEGQFKNLACIAVRYLIGFSDSEQ